MTNTNPNKVNPDQWLSWPPPFTQWWLTTTPGTVACWRWYEPAWGWSMPVSSSNAPQIAGALAMHACDAGTQARILWSHYWPIGARVPRLMPASMYTTPAPDAILDTATVDKMVNQLVDIVSVVAQVPRVRLLGG